MGPDSVVVGPPGVDDRPSVGKVAKQVLVEAFVAEAAIETLDEPVLLRFSRCDIVPRYRPLFLPGQDRVRGHLGAIVAYDHHGKASAFYDPVQFAAQSFARQRCVGDQAEAFPGVVVDHRQHPKGPSRCSTRPTRSPGSSAGSARQAAPLASACPAPVSDRPACGPTDPPRDTAETASLRLHGPYPKTGAFHGAGSRRARSGRGHLKGPRKRRGGTIEVSRSRQPVYGGGGAASIRTFSLTGGERLLP